MSNLLRRRILSLEKTSSLWPQGIITGLRLTIRKMWAPANIMQECNVVQMNEICFSSGLDYKSQIYQYSTPLSTRVSHVSDNVTSNEYIDKAVNNTLTGDKMCIHLYQSSLKNLTTMNNYLSNDPAVVEWNFATGPEFTGAKYNNLFFVTGNDNSTWFARTPRSFTFEIKTDGEWHLVFDYNGEDESVPSNLRQDNMGVILVENGNAISSSYRIEDVCSWEDGDVESEGESSGGDEGESTSEGGGSEPES